MLLLLSCRSSLYIMDTSPLSEICFANIFSCFVSCLSLWAISIPLVSMSVIIPVPHYFGYYSFVIHLEIRKYETYNFILLFQDCFHYLGSLEIPYKFSDGFSYFCKKYHWDFDRNYIKSEDYFR